MAWPFRNILRHVLEVTTQTPIEMLEAACCVHWIVALACTLQSQKNQRLCIPWFMLHLLLLTQYYPTAASQTALNRIVRNKGTEARSRMRELLDSCRGNPLLLLCMDILSSQTLLNWRRVVLSSANRKTWTSIRRLKG
jgi:hypothetical protein